MKRVGLVVVLVLFLLSSPITATVGATTASPQAGQEDPGVTVDADILDGSERLQYQITVENVSGLAEFSMFVGRDAEILTVEGGTVESRAGPTTIEQTAGSDRVRLVVEPTTAGAGEDARVGESFAGDGWRLGSVPFVQLRWRTADGVRQSVRPLGDRFGGLSDDGRGTYGDRYALLGETTEQTHTANGQQIRLVTPTGTDLAPDRRELLAAIGAASHQLDVGDRNDEVLLFALPEPARRGGESYPVRDEAWVAAQEPLDDPNSVWFHEYVHTRQSFELSSEMRWFHEASAEYYAARLAYEQDRVSRAAMHDHLDGEGRTATLTDQSTWGDTRVPYTKGARVVALLDRTIRESTDGERSMEDVFRRMNEHEGQVTYTDFRRIVAAVAGHSMDGWLDRYVAGSTPVASFYANQHAETGLVGFLQDGLAWGGVGLAFVLVSVLCSIVAAVPLYVFLERVDGEQREEVQRPPRGI